MNSHFAIFTGFNEENVLSAKLVNMKSPAPEKKSIEDYNAKDEISNISLSIPFGVSYDIDKKWSVALQYNLGLKKFAEDNEYANKYLKSAKNQQVMLSVAYNFQIM